MLRATYKLILMRKNAICGTSAGVYSVPFQTSKMERFAKIVNGFS